MLFNYIYSNNQLDCWNTYKKNYPNKGNTMKICHRLKTLNIKVIHCFVVFYLLACLTAKADTPLFGNSPALHASSEMGIGWDGPGDVFGQAVGFTPRVNINVSSVTLWLKGYNGSYGQSYSAGIWSNIGPPIFRTNQPGTLVATLVSPGPNNGASAPFTFTNSSGSTVLEANQEYWIFIEGYGTSPVFSYWVSGQTFTGQAVFDTSEYFSGDNFGSESYVPAFTINTPGLSPTIAPFGNQSVIFWPESVTNGILQSLTTTSWVTVNNTVPVIAVTVTNQWPAQFFRLQPNPRPAFNIAVFGSQPVLFWPVSGADYILQSATNLVSPNWVTDSNAIPVIAVTVTNPLPSQFFQVLTN